MSGRLSRRRFAALAAAAGITLGGSVAGSKLLAAGAGTGELLRSRVPRPAPFQRPLTIPPVLRPIRDRDDQDHPADVYEIVQRPATAEILPGLPTEIWGYQGIFPGPTIESRSGRTTIVRHRNELPVPTVVHLHGGHTPPESDGYPTDLVLPVDGLGPARPGHHAMNDPGAVIRRGSADYVYPLRQRAALLWYHDHRMDFTGPAVYRGLAGLHLIRDAEEDALALPPDELELPIMITDRSFGEDGSFRYPSIDPGLRSIPGVRDDFVEGVFGDVILVNGVPWPTHEVAAVKHRLRILNASNARRYDLALDPPPPGGAGLVQLGSDHGLLAGPQAHDHLPIAPAERYDVMIDFGRYPVGSEVTLINRLGSGGTELIMRFLITRRGVEHSQIPDRLSELEPLTRSQAAVTRDFRFRSGRLHDGRRGWLIGSEPFSPTRVDAAPRLGDVEIWRFITDLHHPIHLHLVNFQVLSRGGREPSPFDAGLKDTVDLRPGEAVEIITRFTGYRGRYVFHCHNAEHEDMGMMANFTVV
ncbi:multicopper oxidase family protein [Microlunatus speluncae]|uniref:multicopper oxidase family protein n=1 Tax=Microlunatus speluncae TaxID=2594267 RepID=UPI0012665AE4|nr:multicopper oxidase family protein [Microlunatus speluncae]